MNRTSIALPASLGLAALLGIAFHAGCGSQGSSSEQLGATSGANGSGTHGGPGAAPARLFARLDGFQEVPAISTAGTGTFKATLSADGLTYGWELSYSGLEGDAAGAVSMAHIHLGQRGVSGGIAVHLCGGGDGTAACPASPATLTGTFSAVNVMAIPAQGLAAAEFEELVRAARAGVTYVNVHTPGFGSGEIRGQIKTFGFGRDHDADDADDEGAD